MTGQGKALTPTQVEEDPIAPFVRKRGIWSME